MLEKAKKLKWGPFSKSFQALSGPCQFFENAW
jgi:hypothetical protein